MLPGPLATYVRRCPLISPSSRTPPSEMRWNGLSSARAMDCPSDVLPVPGGPTNLTQLSVMGPHRTKTDSQEDGSLHGLPPKRPWHRSRLDTNERLALVRSKPLCIFLDAGLGLDLCCPLGLDLVRFLGLKLVLPLSLQLFEPFDSEVLDQALLDLVQAIMVRVELRTGIGEEVPVAQGSQSHARLSGPRGRWPGHSSEPFELYSICEAR